MAFPWPAALDSTAVAHAQGPNTPAATVTAMSEFGALRFEVSGGKSYQQGRSQDLDIGGPGHRMSTENY
jgi:hypothetical protein